MNFNENMYPLPNLNLSIVYGIWYILLRVTFIIKVLVDRIGQAESSTMSLLAVGQYYQSLTSRVMDAFPKLYQTSCLCTA